jgi:hypothetical protein
VRVYGKNGLFLSEGDFEFNLALIGLLAAVLIAGFRFGVVTDAIVWGAFAAGLYSIATVRLSMDAAEATQIPRIVSRSSAISR